MFLKLKGVKHAAGASVKVYDMPDLHACVN